MDIPFHYKESFVAFNMQLKRWMHVPSFYKGPKLQNGCGMMACAKGLFVYNIARLPKAYLRKTANDSVWETPTARLQFMVRNPLLGTTKVLPPTVQAFASEDDANKSTVMLEVLDGARGVQEYKITVLYPFSLFKLNGFEGVEIYDSRVGYWLVFVITRWWVYKDRILQTSKESVLYTRRRHVVIDGDMYFVDHPLKSTYWEIDSGGRKIPMLEHGHIIALNLKDRDWRVVYDMGDEKERCPYYYLMTMDDEDYFDDPQLVVVCDYYLVFVVLRLDWGYESYRRNNLFVGWIAFIDVKKNRVVHRTIVPNEMATCLGSIEHCRNKVIGAGHYMCICNPENGAKMIAYDCSKKEWEEWPSCPFPLRKSRECLRTSLGHNGVCESKNASCLMDYQLSYLPV